jgi:hypothetical protein
MIVCVGSNTLTCQIVEFVKVVFKLAVTGGAAPVAQGQPPALLAGMPVGPGVSPQPGFFSRGVWLPVVVTFSSGQAKST